MNDARQYPPANDIPAKDIIMKKLHDLRARTKLFIAYGLFVLPVLFLFYVIVDKSYGDIGFAQKELLGTRYVIALRQVQDAVLSGATNLPSPQLADRVGAAEKELGQDMGTADLANAAMAALKAAADPTRQQARAALRDLIGKVTDGSNLTLDPDLDSYYVMDVVTGKVVDAVDRLYGIATVTTAFAGKSLLTPDEQAEFLVQAGNLVPVLDGLGSSLDTAFKANDRVHQALVAPLKTTQDSARTALAALRNSAINDRSGAAQAASAIVPALAALSSLGKQGATELSRLLDARIAGFGTALIVDLAIAVALFAVGVGFILVAIQSGVVGPLGRITALMQSLSKGDLGVDVPVSGRRDEIGTMAEAVLVFKRNMIEARRLDAEQKGEQEQKERRHQAIEQNIAVFESSMRTSLDTLTAGVGDLRATSKSMSATAEETSTQATTVAGAAEQAAANVQTVAAATEELSSSVAEIGRQVTQSTKIAGEAVTEADRTNVTVQGLSAAAQKIGDVVKLISDIASQTNLLALNATIEAARAGEAGKGFAVVASEVKSLANQTAKATEEISAQVAAMQRATSEAVQAIQSIGGTIGTINEIATTIASAVEEQGAATQEIARNVQEAAQGTGQVSSNIVGVNQAATETGTAANQVLASAEELGRQAETLRGDVDSFLVKIRVA
jgi:methyl-accepting chemotaxis protein